MDGYGDREGGGAHLCGRSGSQLSAAPFLWLHTSGRRPVYHHTLPRPASPKCVSLHATPTTPNRTPPLCKRGVRMM